MIISDFGALIRTDGSYGTELNAIINGVNKYLHSDFYNGILKSIVTNDNVQDLSEEWIERNKNAIEKIRLALTTEYNPLENYDKNSEITTEYGEQNLHITQGATHGENVEKVSAFNEEEPQERASSTMDTNSFTNDNKNDSHTDTVTEHTHGNIGVTKSQEMAMDELNLRMNYNVIATVGNMWVNDFIIGFSEVE